MKRFYHVSNALLGSGSIFLPGNFGMMLNSYCHGFGNLEMLYREEVLEIVREKKYPDKPSRLNSVFLLDTPENAFAYREIHAVNQHIYLVELIDISTPRHIGSWNIVSYKNNFREKYYEYAQKYWDGIIEKFYINPNEKPTLANKEITPAEIITHSEIKILSMI